MKNIFYGGIFAVGVIGLFYIFFVGDFREQMFPIFITIISIIFILIGHKNMFAKTTNKEQEKK